MTNFETNGLQIVNRITKICEEKGIVRKSVSEALGLPDNCFSNWSARGTVPAGDICLKIADYLGVSVEWLISGKESGLSKSERQLLSMFTSLSPTHQEELLEIGEQWAAKDKALEKSAGNA